MNRPLPSGVCVRVKGGLGNQLFIYAAGRSVAHRNGTRLWLDSRSGYARDEFDRKCLLSAFTIAADEAPEGSFYVSASRWRRLLIRRLNRGLPVRWRTYVEQTDNEFMPEILTLEAGRDRYLDGYWQSDRYFADATDLIRAELTITRAPQPENRQWLERIAAGESVAVHCRRKRLSRTLSSRYYSDAIGIVQDQVRRPEFFVFSDDPAWAHANLRFPGPVSFIKQPNVAGSEIADFQLMCACRHFIIANSSFSWWGAWLGRGAGKQVIAPESFEHWGAGLMLPSSWTLVPFSAEPSNLGLG